MGSVPVALPQSVIAMEGFWVVEMRGFEPPTSAVRKQRSPKLSYIPILFVSVSRTLIYYKSYRNSSNTARNSNYRKNLLIKGSNSLRSSGFFIT